MEGCVKEMSLGIIFPPLAVTRMMALRVPLGPVTLTRPVGKDFKEEGPDSGEEGGVRGWGGLGAPLGSVIFTVSWSAALLSAGLTTLLFSNFTTGEKGGVSPSSEWMLELEELEDSWPGEE